MIRREDLNQLTFTVPSTIINEELPDTLVSPQAFLSHQANNGQGMLEPNEYLDFHHHGPETREQHFRIFRDRTEWHKDGKHLLTLPYDESFLPRIVLFKKGTSVSTAKAVHSAYESRLLGTDKLILDPTNQNLSRFKRLWMLWHIRLGHISFSRVLKLALGGILDRQALKLMRRLLQEIATKLNLPILHKTLVRSTVFEDNQSFLSLVNVPKMSSGNKYQSLKYHFFREQIGEDKGIVAKWIHTKEQRADLMTKPLPPGDFENIRKLLMGW